MGVSPNGVRNSLTLRMRRNSNLKGQKHCLDIGLAFVMITSVLINFICTLPFHLISSYIQYIDKKNRQISSWTIFYASCLIGVQACINPLVHSSLSQKTISKIASIFNKNLWFQVSGSHLRRRRTSSTGSTIRSDFRSSIDSSNNVLLRDRENS